MFWEISALFFVYKTILRSFLCFALHNSNAHHFPKMMAIAIELTESAVFEVLNSF